MKYLCKKKDEVTENSKLVTSSTNLRVRQCLHEEQVDLTRPGKERIIHKLWQMIGAGLPSTSRTRRPESMCSRLKGLYRRICCMLNENYPAGWCAPDPFTYEVIAFPCTDRYVFDRMQ
ncbi:hypothetical protein Tcan_07195 [Toxocara canis]|uniref:Uncharacterized protein n=1 Tax=Toxocara canis TaxID=6265 RepID=A0A0B2VJH5_TOXCA|nr:hypothetical protein Tcan_07195 [Toxocara canis]